MDLEVRGMTCGHCEAAVTRAIHGIDPQARVEIDRSGNRVTVETAADPQALKQAIEAEGYDVSVLGR